MTIKEIYEHFQKIDDGTHLVFLEQVKQSLNIFTFLQNEDFCSRIDDLFVFYNENKECFFAIDENNFMSQLFRIRYIIYNMFFTNQYKYSRLYNTLSLEYNPIENYNGKETETINKTNNATETRALKNKVTEMSNTIDSGTDKNDITVNSSKSDTEKQGVQKNSNETTEQVSPYETSEFFNKNQSKINESVGAKENTTTSTENATNTSTRTLNLKNDLTRNAENDDTGTVQNVDSGNVTRTLDKSGNIGVTTSQQMIDAERKVALFNFYKIVSDDIADLIALGVY